MSELCQHATLVDSKTQKKSRPKAASKLMIVDQATTNAGFDFRRQAMKPMLAKIRR